MATARKSFCGVPLALAWGLVVVSLAPSSVNADAQPAIACSAVADESVPDSAQAWLARSMVAGHCYDFQARAVTIDSLGVRTLALSHRIREGVRQQVVQHLDGPSVSIERRSIAGYMASFTPEEGGELSASQAWAEHVAGADTAAPRTSRGPTRALAGASREMGGHTPQNTACMFAPGCSETSAACGSAARVGEWGCLRIHLTLSKLPRRRPGSTLPIKRDRLKL